MMGRILSVILLPTNDCNVSCDYCFEEKSKIQLTLEQVATLADQLIDHMASFHSTEANLYWQGGEVMILGPTWFEQAGEVMAGVAQRAGVTFRHFLQTNLIGWNEGWNNVVHEMFGGSLGTSMDYPNSHRRLKSGSTEKYTEVWLRAVEEVKAAGISVGMIAVLHPDSLAAGPQDFYNFFTETAGITDFQVNMPFPGGPNEGAGTLDSEPLARFMEGLLQVWMDKGKDAGVKVGPFSELAEQFAGLPAQLPCIWQPNCANEFIAIDARGQTALCDCWVTSYPEHSFGNIFQNQSLSSMLESSVARDRFKERPQYLMENEECRTCEWLSMCHGGCPVRTFTAKETIYAKDPYCEVYKVVFSQTRQMSRGLKQNVREAIEPEVPAGSLPTKTSHRRDQRGYVALPVLSP